MQGTNTTQATTNGGIRPAISTTTGGNQGVCAPLSSKVAQATATIQTTGQVTQTRTYAMNMKKSGDSTHDGKSKPTVGFTPPPPPRPKPPPKADPRKKEK